MTILEYGGVLRLKCMLRFGRLKNILMMKRIKYILGSLVKYFFLIFFGGNKGCLTFLKLSKQVFKKINLSHLGSDRLNLRRIIKKPNLRL